MQRVALSQKGRPRPLTPDVVKGVAGSLMAADFRSAQNYLSELKCTALEKENGEDAAISNPVARALVTSKNSANRGLGPSGKAPEGNWDDVSLDPKDTECLGAGELRDPPLRPGFVSCGRLRREIETAGATLANAVLPEETSVAGPPTCPPPCATRQAEGPRASGKAGTPRPARARRPARCAP